MKHYQQPELAKVIQQFIVEKRLNNSAVVADDFVNISEFHYGGALVTLQILQQLEQLPLAQPFSMLDLGCALAGVTRAVVAKFDATCVGFDLSADYLLAAQQINHALKLSQQIRLVRGNAEQLPFSAEQFELITCFHVGMNIADKASCFQQCFALLKSGGFLVIYDQCRLTAQPLSFPLPWAELPEQDHCQPVDDYRQALLASGFKLMHVENYLAKAQRAASLLQHPSSQTNPLSLRLLLGQSSQQKARNMHFNLSEQHIAPYLIIAQKT